MKPLRTYEAAQRLDCTQRTVRRLLDQGKLQGYKIGGTWRVEPDEIENQRKKTYTNSDKSDKSDN